MAAFGAAVRGTLSHLEEEGEEDSLKCFLFCFTSSTPGEVL